ncbi:uncharacterized protein PODANS_1_11500 [Podospora anserina S mat+]|uniref:Lysophospholipase n=1 Tax=Podospora anserina (strain S / ATCC MYA-4624 / DSM 980 / FGSC 10383) TaxID=515849 RepID=B2AYL4_PODAN|nr:uncharacterized protein PODANS_1_11500 [Podospora anserina S mat+]CAP69488.1 unnamed protein product [Podospora anserina S mat+]
MHILDYSTTLAALLLTTSNLASAEPIPVPAVQLSQPNHDLILSPRARPNAPSGGYAPQEVNCPRNKPTVRLADGISKQEEDWLGKRRKETVKPMIDFLKRANLEGFDAEAYINRVAPDVKDLPNVGIAVSGGGYRALMNGAGFVAAADSRTTGATGEGQIGGLLQSSTYLAGLSGGGWLVSSIYTNNFSTVETLRNGREGSSIWKFDRSIFIGPNLPGIFDTTRYWSRVARQVAAKADAGWGRALGYQLIDAEDGGPAYTFSSIALDDEFSAARTPFPILVANGRYPGERIISLNATVYEFNPYEMGSYDPTTYGFVPMEYLGSNFSQGVIPSSGKCVKGFDSVSYIYGTSSSLFNAFMLQNISSVEGVPTFLLNAANATLNILDSNENDIAQYEPNPFLGWNNATNPSAQKIELDLVDGGLDLQNIPLHPPHPTLPPRRCHFCGRQLGRHDAQLAEWHRPPRQFGTAPKAPSPTARWFPPVPDQNTFINLGLNNRPTFFGCDVKNFTLEAGQKVPPLLVYIPNAPYSANSNVSTFTSSYPESQRNEIITNGYNAATQGNGTLDGEWNKCVACAVLSRSLARTGTGVPGECGRCFERYCWDGRLDTKAVEGEYEPGFRVGDASTKDSAAGRAVVMGTGMGLVVGLLGVVVMIL